MRGVTLLELVVALAVVGFTSGLAAVAVTSHGAAGPDALVARLDSARATAVRRGEAVRVHFAGVPVLFLPDGSASGGPVITDSAVYGLDPLTGEVRRAAR